MREYKFRGFTVNEEKFNNGKDGWIYGNLSVLDDVTVDIQDINDNNWFKEVNPESIGQYTGLKDKNGKEIYEGDIVKGTFYGGPMPIYDYVFEIYWNERTKGFMADYFESTECEVIGNMYDNPELLGGNNG